MSKRIISMIMCAVMAFSAAALTGCGDDSSSAESTAKSASADKSVDVSAVADKLFNDIEYKDQLVELAEDMVEAVTGISKDRFKTAKVYRGSGATAEEIDCFEAVDEDAAKEIYDSLSDYIEKQKDRYADYAPAELDKLGKAVIVQNGRYVFLSVSDDDAKAKDIIG